MPDATMPDATMPDTSMPDTSMPVPTVTMAAADIFELCDRCDGHLEILDDRPMLRDDVALLLGIVRGTEMVWAQTPDGVAVQRRYWPASP